MVCTQILVHRWVPRTRISAPFVAVDVTYQGLVLSLAQARLCCVLEKHKAQGQKVELTSSVAEHKGKKGKES